MNSRTGGRRKIKNETSFCDDIPCPPGIRRSRREPRPAKETRRNQTPGSGEGCSRVGKLLQILANLQPSGRKCRTGWGKPPVDGPFVKLSDLRYLLGVEWGRVMVNPFRFIVLQMRFLIIAASIRRRNLNWLMTGNHSLAAAFLIVGSPFQ